MTYLLWSRGIGSESQLHIIKQCVLLRNAAKLEAKDVPLLISPTTTYKHTSSYVVSSVSRRRKRGSDRIHRYRQNTWHTNGSLKITSYISGSASD